MELGKRVKVVRCHISILNGLEGVISEIVNTSEFGYEVLVDGDAVTTPFSESELELIEPVAAN